MIFRSAVSALRSNPPQTTAVAPADALPPADTIAQPAHVDRKHRPSKRTRVFHLYRRPKLESEQHARDLLAHIREQCPEAIGQWVLLPELRKFYGEWSDRRGQPAKHWNAIGPQLGKLTKRKPVKRGGKRFTAYLIPARLHR